MMTPLHLTTDAEGQPGLVPAPQLVTSAPHDPRTSVVVLDETLLVARHVPALLARIGELAARREHDAIHLEVKLTSGEPRKIAALNRFLDLLANFNKLRHSVAPGGAFRGIEVLVRDAPPCALISVHETHYRVPSAIPRKIRPRVRFDLPPVEERVLAPLCYRCSQREACGGTRAELMASLQVQPLEARLVEAASLADHFERLRAYDDLEDPRIRDFERLVLDELPALRKTTAIPVELSVGVSPSGVATYRYILGLSELPEERDAAVAFLDRALAVFCTDAVRDEAARLVAAVPADCLTQLILGIGADGDRVLCKVYLRIGAPHAGEVFAAAGIPKSARGALDMVGYDLDPASGLVATKYYLWNPACAQEELPPVESAPHRALLAGLPNVLRDLYEIYQSKPGDDGAGLYAVDFDVLRSGMFPERAYELLAATYGPHPALTGVFKEAEAVLSRLSLNRKGAADGANVYYLLWK